MAAPTTVAQLLELIEKSEIVDRKLLADQLDQLRNRGEMPQTPADLADYLRRVGLLTRFQAQQFLQGKWKNFIISGKYILLDMLGAGGMANVFLCEHRIMRRKVALKVLPNDLAKDPSSVDRFHREARAVAALDHPNIVRAHDVDKEGKLHFLVMEYVDGTNLHHLVSRHGKLEVPVACWYIYQAALGLQHAHEAGVVHRDIKPGNLLVDRSGTVKILDMGLARFFNDQADSLTRDYDGETVLGTADFLAPEQVVNSHEVDARADIYSLGLTFYFLLAGRGPFDGGTVAQKLIWHQTRKPRPIREARPDVPEEVAAILEKMTAKEAGDRYQTAAEVAQALLPWTGGLAAGPASVEVQRAAAAALPVSVSGLGSVPVLPAGGKSPSPRSPVSPPRSPVLPCSEPSPSAAAVPEPRLAATPPPAPPSSRKGEGGLPPTSLSVSTSTPLPARDLDLGLELNEAPGKGKEAQESSATPHRLSREAIQAASRGNIPPSPGVSPDLAPAAVPPASVPLVPTVIIDAEEGIVPPPYWRIWVFLTVILSIVVGVSGTFAVLAVLQLHASKTTENPTTEATKENPNPPVTKKPASKPKPQEPVLVGKARLEKNPNVVRVYDGHPPGLTRAVFQRSGAQILSAGADGQIRVWSTKTGQIVNSLAPPGPPSPVLDLAVSPDSRLAATCNKDRKVRIWVIDRAELLHTIDGELTQTLAFSADSRILLCGTASGTVRLHALANPKEWSVLAGHRAPVTGICPTPNGRHVVTVSLDETLRLWEIAAQEEVWSIQSHPGGVTAVDCSPLGRYFVSGGADNLLRLWDLDTGTLIRTFSGHTGPITRVVFLRDGDRIVSSSTDRTIRVWETITGRLLDVLDSHDNSVTSVATVAAGGKRLVSACADRLVCQWQVPKYDPFHGEVRRLPGHTAQVECVAVSPDGRLLASGSHDRTARLWELETGRELRQYRGHSGAVLSVAFSPDGQLLASSGQDKTVRLWDVGSDRQLWEMRGHGASVYSVVFSPDGRLLLSSSQDKTFRLWEVRTGAELGAIQAHPGALWNAVFSPDGRTIATSGADKVVRLWDPWTGEKLGELAGHNASVRRLAFSPDGQRLLTASFDSSLRLWNPQPGKELRKFEAPPRFVEGVAFSPDGRFAVSSEGPELRKDGKYITDLDHGVRIWDLASGKQLHRFGHVHGKVFQVLFTPDGRHVVAGCEDKLVRIWRLPPLPLPIPVGELRAYATNQKLIDAVALSPDGKLLASASRDGAVRLTNFSTGKMVRSLENKDAVAALAFSPDGSQVLTGGKEKIARLWDVQTGKEVQKFEGHTGKLRAVLFSHDGKQVFTASEDKTARLWDAQTGQVLREFSLKKPYRPMTSLALSPDGRLLLTGSLDKTARLWDVATGQMLRVYLHGAEVTAVAFVPDGQSIATGGTDGLIWLWEMATGKKGQPLEDHHGPVTTLNFTPDGQRLLTGSTDATLRLWNVRTAQPEVVYNLAPAPITNALIARDGRLALASGGSSVRLLGLPPLE